MRMMMTVVALLLGAVSAAAQSNMNAKEQANVKYVLDVERTVFDDNAPGARPAENGIAFRTQLNF